MINLRSKIEDFSAFDFNVEELEVESFSDMNNTDLNANYDSTPENLSIDFPGKKIATFEKPMFNECSGLCLDTYDTKTLIKEDGFSVTVFPDYIIYENNLYEEAQLIFSTDSIQVKSSYTSENHVVECAVADISYIGSQWIDSVGATLVKFHFKTKTVNREKTHDTHDFKELMISVTDMSWLDKEHKIKCLAERYKVAWKYELEEACVEHKSFFPSHEIPCSFEDVVYPKGDPDAVTISRRDIELLEPDTYVNDTIIDFYIKYLRTKIPVDERQRYHFFNSFFFRKLADLDKNPDSASDGRAAFLRVRKWTRKIDIFEKDYVFIPVNFNSHWSLLVICHPGELTTLNDEIKHSPKVPCILHMDSFKGIHSGLEDLIGSYLLDEWKERHLETTENCTFKFSNLRSVSLELPQQENSFDCGLFLLHYVEMFLGEAPLNFNPINISKFSSFLTADWFIPSEASLKRSHVRKLIYDILNDSLQNVASELGSNDSSMKKNPISKHYTNNCEEFVLFQLLESSAQVVKNDKLEQHNAFLTSNDVKDVEEVDIQLNSMQGKKEGDLVILARNGDDNVICEDCQGIEVVTVEDGQRTDTHNVNSEDSNDIIDVDDKAVGDGSRNKREGSYTKNGVCSRKKGKFSQPEAARWTTLKLF